MNQVRSAQELNFDGLVGPTHNYAGLSLGNLASLKSKGDLSHPLQAALEGLKKMKLLMDLGVPQGILPPHERPHLSFLRSLGFSGKDSDILQQVSRNHPLLLASACSASSMWAANAATISPSCDTEDGRVHFTPANLVSNLHRSLEAAPTAEILKIIFSAPEMFCHHPPLPPAFCDEGAANHTRLCSHYGAPGQHLFVYARQGFGRPNPTKFPYRQTLEASQAIARSHRLSPQRVLFIQQLPQALDAGVFHNDVISVGNQSLFLFHEKAFAKKSKTLRDLRQRENLILMEVKQRDFSLADAVSSYFFNSQVVTRPDGRMALLAPQECQENPRVRRTLESLLSRKNPMEEVFYLTLRQSMKNGGGPACLRLRVVLTPEERAAVNPGFLLTDRLYDHLVKWVRKHYREDLRPRDLADPQFLEESRRALDELTGILPLKNFYAFQSEGTESLLKFHQTPDHAVHEAKPTRRHTIIDRLKRLT